LADETEKEATGQINQQSAVGKSAPHANLHDALKAVTRQRACGAKDRNQRETQFLSNLQPARERQWTAGASVNKKLLARGRQESSDPANNAGTVMANSIAFEISSHFNRFGKWQTGDLVARSMVAGKVKEHQSANRGEITILGAPPPSPRFL